MYNSTENKRNDRTFIVPPQAQLKLLEDALVSQLCVTEVGHRRTNLPFVPALNPDAPGCIFVYCHGGEGWYKYKTQKFPISAGQAFMLPVNNEHSYGPMKRREWEISWIRFEGTRTVSDYYLAHQLFDFTGEKGGDIRRRVSTVLDEMLDTLERGCSSANLVHCTALLTVLLSSVRSFQGEETEAGQPKNEDCVVATLTRYMEANIHRHVTLKELAELVGYSPTYLSSFFKRQSGFGPIAYFNIMKMQRACYLLDTTTRPILDICKEIGIKDNYYFSRLFSNVMGISPKQYRQRPAGYVVPISAVEHLQKTMKSPKKEKE